MVISMVLCPTISITTRGCTPSASSRLTRRLAERGPVEALELASHFTEYAGWLHQDSGDLVHALRLTDEAVDLADAAGDAGLAAYTLMRKSNVLTSLGEAARASLTARRAATLASREAPAQQAVCLRQVALAEAAQHNETPARDAIEQALILLSTSPSSGNDLSPYCTPSCVEMEHALCLLALDQPVTAAEACMRALATWPAGFVRDEGLCLVRLAVAQLRMHRVDDACASALEAIERVQVAPSARTLDQLRAVSRAVQPYRDARSVRQFREALARVA